MQGDKTLKIDGHDIQPEWKKVGIFSKFYR